MYYMNKTQHLQICKYTPTHRGARTRAPTCAHAHVTHQCIHMQMPKTSSHKHTYVGAHVDPHKITQAHIYTHTHTHICIDTCAYILAHTYVHAHTQTLLHAHAHTRTYTRKCLNT